MEFSGIRSGTWRQEGGSEMELVVQDGMVTGVYRTVHGRVEAGQAFPLVGMVNGELIGFSVSWGEAQSLTSWCGRYARDAQGRESIRTMWLLGRMFNDTEGKNPTQPWETFHVNSGTFFLV